jgi:hypothetical protein
LGGDQPQDAQTWRKVIQELLSPTSDAGVFWSKSEADAYWLHESRNRQALAKRLADADQVFYRKWLADQVAWARTDLEKLAAADRKVPRRYLANRVGLLRMADFEGEAGRERLLNGEPLVVRLSAFMEKEGEGFLREWVQDRPDLAQLDRDELGRYSLVFLRERSPFHPASAGLTISWVKPSGFKSVHGSCLRLPYVPSQKRTLDDLDHDRPNESSKEPPVTFCLTPEPNAKPGERVTRKLDELLDTVSQATGLTIVADGYLRPGIEFPANLKLRDCPLDRLLTRIADLWDCDWRFLAGNPKVVLVRSRYWWLEDAADVPQEQLDDFRARLNGAQPPRFEDLCRFAELSDAQIQKLYSLGECRAAAWVLFEGLFDGVGVKPCLQMLNRATAAQREQAFARDGLSLSALSPEARAVFRRTMIAEVGAISEEAQRSLTLWIEPVPGLAGGTPAGFKFEMRDKPIGGCHWFVTVQAPSPPPK